MASNNAGPVPVTGTLAATGRSTAFTPDPGRDFNATLSGTWVGTVTLDRSFDNGSTWSPCTNLGAALSFTANLTEIVREPEGGVQYSFNFTRTSGSLVYRLSQ